MIYDGLPQRFDYSMQPLVFIVIVVIIIAIKCNCVIILEVGYVSLIRRSWVNRL